MNPRRLGAVLFGIGALAAGCTVGPPAPMATPTPVPATMTPLAATATAVPATATPTPVPRPTATPTAPAVVPALTPTPASELVVTIGEATLGERVNAALVGQPLVETPFGTATVRSMAVQILAGQILITGDAGAGPLALPIGMTATVDVRAGRPVITVRDATVGGAPLPEGARQQIELILQTEVDEAVARENVAVRAVTLEDGELTVRGRRRE